MLSAYILNRLLTIDYERHSNDLLLSGVASGSLPTAAQTPGGGGSVYASHSPVDNDVDMAADVIISGIQAVMALRDTSLRESVQVLSQSDDSLRVRQAALEALKHIGT